MTGILVQWGSLLVIPLIALLLIRLTKANPFFVFLGVWLLGAYLLTNRAIYLEKIAPDSDFDIIFALAILLHSFLLGVYYGIIILTYSFFTFLISKWSLKK